MCSVIILYRPSYDWPVIIAANRDEMVTRSWWAPGYHWPNRPGVVAGLDELAGGSWLGLNAHGVIAIVLNRVGTLGPIQGKRSRGELVLAALEHADARTAGATLCAFDPTPYRSFNLLVADPCAAYWLRYQENNDGEKTTVQIRQIPAGVSMLTGFDLNDVRDPRIRDYWPAFQIAAFPVPETGNWSTWQALLMSRVSATDASPKGAMCFTTNTGFCTCSSSLIALPASRRLRPPVWLFANGPPDQVGYEAIMPFLPV